MRQATNRLNVTIAVMVATFLTAMDSTVVSTAMPTIISELGGIKLTGWVFAVYLLTTSVTTPIWGKLADLFGRKIIFTIGTSIFLLGSMLSGASHSMEQLIVFRAFQGIGAGAVFPITLTIIGDLYSFEERAKIQGLFSAIWGISGILGPLIGGFFVDWLTWRWIFYINLPVGLASMILIWIFLHERFERHKKRIDYGGAITFSIGMTALLYALLAGGGTYAWNSAIIIGAFVVSAVFLTVFLYIETKSQEPILPLRLFSLRVITVSNLAGFLSSVILIGLTIYLPWWIQGVFGGSATNAGLVLAPMSIGWPLGATLGGWLMLKIGFRTTSLTGMIVLVGGTLWLSAIGIQSQQWVLVAIMLIVGFGFGFSSTAFTVLVQSAVGWNMRGAATASNQFMRTLGQTIGSAVFGTWFNQVIAGALATGVAGVSIPRAFDMGKLLRPESARKLPANLLHAMREVLVSGLHSIYLALFIIAIIGFVVVLWLPRHIKDQSTQESQDNKVLA